MKTVLFLLDRYPAFGGIETVTTLLSHALAEHYRIIICAQRNEHAEELLPQLGARITYHLLPQGEQAETIEAFRRLLAQEHVDVVIYQDSYAPNEFLPLSISKDSGVKLIVAEHSSPSHPLRWLWQSLSLCPWWNLPKQAKLLLLGLLGYHRNAKRRTTLYNHCDRYILLADSLRREFRQNSYTSDTQKLGAIGNPVSYAPQPVEPSQKKKQVLFIGQFVALKGIERLLRIWQRVAAQVPDWELVLVGDGPTMPEVQQRIEQEALPRVSLEGFRNNIADYCREASVLCMCSTFEGFPMVLPEAMCSGAVPMAFGSFAALNDIITDGVSGIKIPPFAEETYAAKLLELMQDEELRARMSQAASVEAGKFNLERIVWHWREVIDQLPG